MTASQTLPDPVAETVQVAVETRARARLLPTLIGLPAARRNELRSTA